MVALQNNHSEPRITSGFKNHLFSSLSRIVLVCVLFALTPGYASTILEVSFPDLCADAELIFEGQVINHSVSQDPATGNIWTEVSFRVIEKIKGPEVEDTLTLRFLGGTVGDLTLKISDMHVPALNERGIYFVESLRENLVNPLLGWSQGHYLIETDNTGTARITTEDQVPVSEIETNTSQSVRLFSAESVTDNATTADQPPLTDALTVPDFKALIQQQLQ